MVEIRKESSGDRSAVEELNRQAFGGEYEARLLGRLDAEGLSRISLVAVRHGEIVGHILFSTLPVSLDGRDVRALALGPMAVRPGLQRTGIGSLLVRHGLEAGRQQGFEAVVVLGHTEYYPRFGFRPDLAEKLEAPFKGEAFMALELRPGALDGSRGQVTYPQAWFEE